MEKIAEKLKPQFSSYYIQSYEHWKNNGEPLMDFALESQKLKEYISTLSEDYIILAKSIGVLLALKTMHEGIIAPKRCYFLGTAVKLAKRLEYPLEVWISNYAVPTLFVQKNEDPACTVVELKELLVNKSVKNASLVTIPGTDHNYDDMELIEQAVIKFEGLFK